MFKCDITDKGIIWLLSKDTANLLNSFVVWKILDKTIFLINLKISFVKPFFFYFFITKFYHSFAITDFVCFLATWINLTFTLFVTNILMLPLWVLSWYISLSQIIFFNFYSTFCMIYYFFVFLLPVGMCLKKWNRSVLFALFTRK